jgi:hypothetical protein
MSVGNVVAECCPDVICIYDAKHGDWKCLLESVVIEVGKLSSCINLLKDSAKHLCVTVRCLNRALDT